MDSIQLRKLLLRETPAKFSNFRTVRRTGVTGNIRQRVYEHKTGTFKGSFTSWYKLDRLVYFEKFKRVGVAIAREKQLKRWIKIKKIQLIVSMNPPGRIWPKIGFPELKEQKKKTNA